MTRPIDKIRYYAGVVILAPCPSLPCLVMPLPILHWSSQYLSSSQHQKMFLRHFGKAASSNCLLFFGFGYCCARPFHFSQSILFKIACPGSASPYMPLSCPFGFRITLIHIVMHFLLQRPLVLSFNFQLWDINLFPGE